MKPTFEEFYDAVEQGFKKRWQVLEAEEAERYIASEIDFIKMRYAEISKEFDDGLIDRKTFMIGGVASVAHCLEMMY